MKILLSLGLMLLSQSTFAGGPKFNCSLTYGFASDEGSEKEIKNIKVPMWSVEESQALEAKYRTDVQIPGTKYTVGITVQSIFKNKKFFRNVFDLTVWENKTWVTQGVVYQDVTPGRFELPAFVGLGDYIVSYFDLVCRRK